MGRPVSTDDLDQLRAALFVDNDNIRVEMRRGFDATNQRQDRTNGRIDLHDERHHEFMRSLTTHSELIAGLVARVENLNAEVFKRPPALPPDLVNKVSSLITKLDPEIADARPVVTVGDAKKFRSFITSGWGLVVAAATVAGWVWAIVEYMK